MRISRFNFEKRLVVFVSWYDRDELVHESLLATQYVHSDTELNYMIDFYRKNYNNIERDFLVEYVSGIVIRKRLKSVLTIKTFNTL